MLHAVALGELICLLHILMWFYIRVKKQYEWYYWKCVLRLISSAGLRMLFISLPPLLYIIEGRMVEFTLNKNGTCVLETYTERTLFFPCFFPLFPFHLCKYYTQITLVKKWPILFWQFYRLLSTLNIVWKWFTPFKYFGGLGLWSYLPCAVLLCKAK